MVSRCSGEGFGRAARIQRSAEFLRCYRQGRKRHSSLAVLHFHPNEEAMARLGITAGRKVGKAVLRHRAKRRVREIFRRWPGRHGLGGLDIVVHLKTQAAGAPFSMLRSELERMLSSLPHGEREGR